jgi:Ca2+-transporting ATPase
MTDLSQGQLHHPAPGATRARLEVLHATVPGRIRFRCGELRRNPSLVSRFEHELLDYSHFKAVEANPVTGTLLVFYSDITDVSQITSQIGSWLSDTLPDSIQQNESEEGGDEPVWHTLRVAETLARLGSKRGGLSATAIALRQAQFGANALPETRGPSDFSIFCRQMVSWPVALLGVSAVVSIATGGLVDAAAIGTVILVNATVGFATERQAEKTISLINKSPDHTVEVIRGNKQILVTRTSIVPGDVLLLTPGTVIAGDARIIEANRLTLDESMLTGESMPVEKHPERIDKVRLPLADRSNMTYLGSMVTGGSGRAVVVAIGANTEAGRIQDLAQTARPPQTPVERQLDTLGGQLALASGIACVGVFAIGMLRGRALPSMLSSAASLATAAVPEGLPTVATTTLALGIHKLGSRGALVRRLDAVETLGTLHTVCLDKTGTITENRMSVASVVVGDKTVGMTELTAAVAGDITILDNVLNGAEGLLKTAILCSDAEAKGDPSDPQFSGSPTEVALLRAAKTMGADLFSLRDAYPRLRTRYRSESQRYMSTLHRGRDSGRFLAVKGSPREVLDLSTQLRVSDGELRDLDEDWRARILTANEALAQRGLRVLGVARSATLEDDGVEPNGVEPDNLIWCGLVGLIDPIRGGVKQTLEAFHRAGIETAMITGDQSSTAQAIARELDLANGKRLEAIDSVTLDQMDPDLLAGILRRVQVFARVSPAHKLAIVQALQRGGKVVAMTGDGINDGPALRVADLGIAMGGEGSSVAGELADIVLKDDKLETLIGAIAQGRTIFRNIRKSVRFLLSSNFSEIAVMAVGTAISPAAPMNPMQLLWINLLTDVAPALALGLDPPEPDELLRPPRAPMTPILDRRDLRRLIYEGLTMTAGGLASYGYATLRYGAGPRASTHVFMTLTLSQLLNAISSRSEHHRVFGNRQLARNPFLTASVAGSIALQGLALFAPPLRKLLGTTPVSLSDLIAIAASAITPALINDATKPSRDGLVSSTNAQHKSATTQPDAPETSL